MSLYSVLARPAPLTTRRIDNPLRHYTLPQLDNAAREFATKIGADPELFVKAARIARDPPNWEQVDKEFTLTDLERSALKYEKKNGFFRQPKTLKTTVITLVFSALTQGWIQSV